nr:Plasmodium yoelii repeat (PY_rept_46) [Moritella viscosa]
MVEREKQDNHTRKVQKSLDSYDVNKPLEEEDYFEEVLKDLS